MEHNAGEENVREADRRALRGKIAMGEISDEDVEDQLEHASMYEEDESAAA